MSPERAAGVARDVLAQDAGNVRTLRPRVQQPDPNAELRSASLDAYQWTLVLTALVDRDTSWSRELASELRAKLEHPSARRVVK